MGRLPCGCDGGENGSLGPGAKVRGRGKSRTWLTVLYYSLMTCSRFRIAKLWSFLANPPKCEENDSGRCLCVERFGSTSVQFLQCERLFGMFGVSVAPAVLPSRAPRRWKTFPTIQSILRTHSAIEPFSHTGSYIWSSFSCRISSEISFSQCLESKNKTCFIGFLPCVSIRKDLQLSKYFLTPG